MARHADPPTQERTLQSTGKETLQGHEVLRRAVGYIRVSTDMQATEGLSLEAQQAAIERFCAAQGFKLVRLCQDVISGAKDQRPGLQEALGCLQRNADVLVVLKFDRLSRSIRHFCEIYERYFESGEKELIAIRESIRLDSALGRALISILLVFAQMEREATGERTRESIRHIRSRGYFFGKVPYDRRTVPAPDNPRYRILIEDPAEQAVLARLNAWAAEGLGISEMAARLNTDGVLPPQGERWTKSVIYNLKLRLSLIKPRPHNQRPHTDDELKARMLELRSHGHTHAQIASILNEQKWVPLKGSHFTEVSVRKLLGRTDQTKQLGPRQYLENLLTQMERLHAKESPGVPFQRPGFPKLALLLAEVGYVTPKGHAHWWPAQVQQLLEGRFDRYYAQRARTLKRHAAPAVEPPATL
jgi:DNA invertase Pin-like site-specific DNA recombinase